MTYFGLRKRDPDPEPEPAELEEEQPDEADEEASAAPGHPLIARLAGPGRWIAARFGMGAAWGVHIVAGWAVVYYGGRVAAGIVLVWLGAVGLFIPREVLDRLSDAIERRVQGRPAATEDTAEDPGDDTEDEPPGPDPEDVLDLVRDLIGDDRGVLLTVLRQPLRAADTRAVREVLAAAGIGVRPGVRTAAGNGPGVHRDDLPPLPPARAAAPVEDVAAGERANTNANNALRVQSREGMTIINDPADRHRTHTLKKP